MTSQRRRGRAPAPRRAALLLVLATLLPSCAARRGGRAGEEPSQQRVEVPGHGALEIAVPRDWTATIGEGEDPMPVTVRLEPPGGAFVVLLTPFWNAEPPTGDDRLPDGPGSPEGADGVGERNGAPASGAADVGADTAQILAELARRKALLSSAEQEIALHELRGEVSHGYWFSATDRSLADKTPGEHEWRHILQGAASVGELILAFTLLDNAPGPQREAVLGIVRSARHVPTAGTAPEAPRDGAMRFETDAGAETLPLYVPAPRHAWAVLVDLPGFHMFKPRPTEEGTGVLVLGESSATGVVASVTIHEDAGAADARTCRDAALEKIRKTAPELKELKVDEAGPAARASYVLDELRGRVIRQDHAHLFLARDGACVNVKVSKADPEPEDGARIEAILSSVRFGERL